jgi:hypothetical protein
MKNNYLTAERDQVTVTYGNKDYRIYEDRGNRHIIVFEQGKRRKITVKTVEKDPLFDYIFNYGFKNSDENLDKVIDGFFAAKTKYQPMNGASQR